MSGSHQTLSIAKEREAVLAAKSDPRRFSPLYDRYYKPIFVFVFKRVREKETTADVTSQIFLKALVNIHRYEDRGLPFSSWLFRIAVNEVNQFFREQKKEKTVPIAERDLAFMMEEADEEDSERNRQLMVQVLNELPEASAQMIELRFFERYSFREIGEVYNIQESNAKVKIYRILKSMKKAMERAKNERK